MNKKKKTAVVLISGGIDSTVTAAIAKREGYNLKFLFVNYGQPNADAEYHAVMHLVEPLGAQSFSRVVIDRLVEGDSSKDFFIPFRNSVLLSVAAHFAKVWRAVKIYYGAIGADYEGYPDCRIEFVNAFNEMLSKSLKDSDKEIKVVAPLFNLNKFGVISEGMKLDVPFEFTWSCYENNYEPACGVCDSCKLRRKAFEEAGIEDPLTYEK